MDESLGLSYTPLKPEKVQENAAELVGELVNAVKDWKLKKEMTYEGNIYRNYSATIADVNGTSGATFIQVQLIYKTPSDTMPIAGSVTETAPDANGSLREHHFAANVHLGTESEIKYVEHPYHQAEFGQPTVNTEAAVDVARGMIKRLPVSD